ncbi:MAG: hypothetical protein CUN55_07495 [Phototrophicales bacterium]|nr:MAG: hypothetical protein CUN55_07495 [Phototrophicales bacterium]
MSDTPKNEQDKNEIVDTNDVIANLLKEGIAAARLGDRETARNRLRQVIELDRNNEKAWFWLAAVVETVEERRQCLESVLLINPNNQRAQTLLEQIEHAKSLVESKTKSGGRSGIIAIAVGAAILIATISFGILTILGNGDDEDKGTAATDVVAVAPTNTVPPTQSNTLIPTNTATPRPTLPPMATSTPTSTPLPTNTPLPTLSTDNISGQLFIISGDFFFSAPEYQQLFILPLDDPTQLLSVTGQNVRGRVMSVSPNADKFVTEQYNSGQDIITLQVININGTESISLSRYWDRPLLTQQKTPRWSPNTPQIVFVGKTGFDREHDLYVIAVSGELDPEIPEVDPNDPDATPPPSPLVRMTMTEDVDETWPAWSPDGKYLVYVADTSLSGTGGVDLRMLDIQTLDVYAITNDGLDVVESMPNWGGPNGNLIVYSATNPDGTSDIWIVDASQAYFLETTSIPDVVETATPDTIESPDAPSETATPIEESTLVPTEEPTSNDIATSEPNEDVDILSGMLLIDLGPQDIMPIWSPDGRYIVFSSNTVENPRDFDIYIYDYETGELFSVLVIPDSREVAYDWFE